MFKSALDGISNLLNSILDFIGNIPTYVWNMFKSALEGMSNLLTLLLDFVKNIPTYVWNMFKSALEGIYNTINLILDFFNNFFNALFDFIKNMFVPGDNYFVDNYNSLNNAMSGKLGVDTGVLEDLVGSSSYSELADPVFKQSFKLMGSTVNLDYSFITKIRGITLGVSNGLMVIFLCWYNVRKVIWLIRGSEPVGGSNQVPGQMSFFN